MSSQENPTGEVHYPTWDFPCSPDVPRGQGALFGHRSKLRTGHIDMFFNEDGGDWPVVSAQVILGNDTFPDAKTSPEFVGSGAGFRHIYDPYPSGNRFCFPWDGEEACAAVIRWMKGDRTANQPPTEWTNKFLKPRA